MFRPHSFREAAQCQGKREVGGPPHLRRRCRNNFISATLRAVRDAAGFRDLGLLKWPSYSEQAERCTERKGLPARFSLDAAQSDRI